MDTVFDMEFERTEFSDGVYGVAGRALAYAQMFEHDCRALNLLIQVRTRVRTGALSLDDQKSLDAFIVRIHGLSLRDHLAEFVEYSGLRDLAVVFNEARDGRNSIAHDMCVGIQRDVEAEVGRQRLVREAAAHIRRIAEAHLAVLLLVSIENRQSPPARHYLENYADRVVNWVSNIEGG